MLDLTLNIKHKMQVMLITVGDIWRRFLSVMRFFGQMKAIQTLGQCCRDKDLSLQSIMYLPDALFQVCSQQLVSVNYTEGLHRRTRGISFLSQVFGDGGEILKIENTLAEAIQKFNENFRRERKPSIGKCNTVLPY